MLAVGLLGPSILAASPLEAAEVRSVTLKNGLMVLLAPDAEATALDVAVWYRAGTRYEKPGTIGITYLFGRLMFRGSRQFPAGDHRRLLEAEGASVNSVSNPDFICFYQTLPREALELALRLEADRMAALDITQDKVDAELASVRDERRRRIDMNPVGRGLEELYRQAFTGHAYGYPVIGVEQDLARITLQDVEAYYRERFSPENAVVTVVGGFDPENALSLVRRHFERLPKRSGTRFSSTPLSPQREEHRGFVPSGAATSLLLVGWRGGAARDPDGPALELVHRLLTGGPSSRLDRALIGTDRDITGTKGELDQTREAALFLCMATVRPGADSASAERALVTEVEKLAHEPVAVDELERAKRRLEAEQLFQSETVRHRAASLGTAQLLQDSPRPVYDRLERVRKLAPLDLQRAAAKVLRAAGRSVVWVRSPGPSSSPAGEGGSR
jgi:zinc protease